MSELIFLRTDRFATWVTREYYDQYMAQMEAAANRPRRQRLDDAQIEMRLLEQERQFQYDRQDSRR